MTKWVQGTTGHLPHAHAQAYTAKVMTNTSSVGSPIFGSCRLYKADKIMAMGNASPSAPATSEVSSSSSSPNAPNTPKSELQRFVDVTSLWANVVLIGSIAFLGASTIRESHKRRALAAHYAGQKYRGKVSPQLRRGRLPPHILMMGGYSESTPVSSCSSLIVWTAL